MKAAAPWALSVALGGALGYAVLGWYGGVYHFAGLRHLPGACEPCDRLTAQSVVGLVNAARAQAAAVQSGG